ncbi:MAG: MerR family transcriptional regulator [Oscillospiraceae bacterium]|nr:MerR family transcriptional regulator [Oscillospiraceae bacterium]
MNDLIKAGDLSNRYGVSTRTLRYYEEAGLIASRRTNDYAYRMYDDANVKRLEQILILRKLNISIKDIRRIFSAAGSEVVLEVLGKKVDDIDEEVALLHELKEIVITFIRQIEQADFSKDSDVKLLYDRAREIKTQLANAEYAGNPSPVHRLFEVAEKLEEKAVSRLLIPDNVLKRALENVYFIWGDGADVAEELGRRHGYHVYHTCDHRYKHSRNADPQYQPELSRDVHDFYALDPQDAMQHETGVVHDYTPMVIMDLVQLLAQHEKVICENDIDIDSIMQIVTHAVIITNDKNWDNFIEGYENDIRRRDISEVEKEKLIRKLDAVWGKGKPENPRGATKHDVKQIIRDDSSTVEHIADVVEKYFGLPTA